MVDAIRQGPAGHVTPSCRNQIIRMLAQLETQLASFGAVGRFASCARVEIDEGIHSGKTL